MTLRRVHLLTSQTKYPPPGFLRGAAPLAAALLKWVDLNGRRTFFSLCPSPRLRPLICLPMTRPIPSTLPAAWTEIAVLTCVR